MTANDSASEHADAHWTIEDVLIHRVHPPILSHQVRVNLPHFLGGLLRGLSHLLQR